MALWFLDKAVWFVLAAVLEGILLPSNVAAKATLCLYLVKHFDIYVQMCCKRYNIIFSTFSLKFTSKICFQKEVIHNFKNHTFWSRDQLRTYSF